jgi:hypothetical protein
MTDRPDQQGTGGKTTQSQQVREAARDEQMRQHREDLLDDALKETFPASDPPSIARPERRPPSP